MGILSNSFNLLSKSVSKVRSSVVPGDIHIHRARVCSDMKRHYKLNYLVSRRQDGHVYHSRIISTDQTLHYDDLDFPNTMRTQYFLPSDSCNSLLFAYHDRLSSALWNPTTDEVKALPESSVPKEACFISFGFGFDCASQDYKVIRFFYFLSTRGTIHDKYAQVELYSLKSDSWKEITYTHFPPIPMMILPSVHINGFTYWVTPKLILSFDFANEEFSTAPHIPLPETDKLSDPPSNCLLAEYDGSLAALVYEYHDDVDEEMLTGKPLDIYDGKPLDIEIWVWKDIGVWARVLVSEIIDPVTVRKPLGLFNNDEFYFQDWKGQLFLFRCAKRELKNLGLKADPSEVFVLPYVKSAKPIKA